MVSNEDIEDNKDDSNLTYKKIKDNLFKGIIIKYQRTLEGLKVA